MRSDSTAAIALATTMALAASCRDTSGPREGEACNPTQWLGSFEGNASGALSDTLAGCAYFSFLPPPVSTDQPGRFGMVLTDGSATGSGLRIRILRDADGISPGTYTIGTGAGQLYGRIYVPDNAGVFLLTAGTITVLGYFNATDPAGTLGLTATDTLSAATITITGKFAATCVEIPPPIKNDDDVDPTRNGVCKPPGSP